MTAAAEEEQNLLAPRDAPAAGDDAEAEPSWWERTSRVCCCANLTVPYAVLLSSTAAFVLVLVIAVVASNELLIEIQQLYRDTSSGGQFAKNETRAIVLVILVPWVVLVALANLMTVTSGVSTFNLLHDDEHGEVWFGVPLPGQHRENRQDAAPTPPRETTEDETLEAALWRWWEYFGVDSVSYLGTSAVGIEVVTWIGTLLVVFALFAVFIFVIVAYFTCEAVESTWLPELRTYALDTVEKWDEDYTDDDFSYSYYDIDSGNVTLSEFMAFVEDEINVQYSNAEEDTRTICHTLDKMLQTTTALFVMAAVVLAIQTFLVTLAYGYHIRWRSDRHLDELKK